MNEENGSECLRALVWDKIDVAPNQNFGVHHSILYYYWSAIVLVTSVVVDCFQCGTFRAHATDT